MKNTFRALIEEGQVSITAIDATSLVAEGVRVHGLTGKDAESFGKTLCFCAFLSSSLKEERGQVSLSLQSERGTYTVSGNYQMHLRGCFDKAEGYDGDGFGEGTLTVIRQDGYGRPFVGACQLSESADESFAEYFRISEQLPTTIATRVEQRDGAILFAGIIAVQPLPFASEKALQNMPKGERLETLLEALKTGGEKSAFNGLDVQTKSEKYAVYQCNCSREYLLGAIVTLGEKEVRKMIAEDGAVRVHCHYCNTDYEFTEKDADEAFLKG